MPHGGRFMEQYWHLPGRRLAASAPRTLRQVIRVYQNRGGLEEVWGAGRVGKGKVKKTRDGTSLIKSGTLTCRTNHHCANITRHLSHPRS